MVHFICVSTFRSGTCRQVIDLDIRDLDYHLGNTLQLRFCHLTGLWPLFDLQSMYRSIGGISSYLYVITPGNYVDLRQFYSFWSDPHGVGVPPEVDGAEVGLRGLICHHVIPISHVDYVRRRWVAWTFEWFHTILFVYEHALCGGKISDQAN